MLTYLVLFAGAFLAAALSGAAGFGGALLLLPLLVHTQGAVVAVPLLTVAQLVGSFSRVTLWFHEIRWRPVGIFLLGAVPLSIIGSLSFVALPKPLVVRLIETIILLFVVLRHGGLLRVAPGTGLLLVGGGIVGFLSGLVGSAGPLGVAIFLVLQLPAGAYIASEATTALVLHMVKTVVYQRYLHVKEEVWLLAAYLGVAMVLGTWAGKRVIERMPAEQFRRFVEILLVILSLQMVIFG